MPAALYSYASFAFLAIISNKREKLDHHLDWAEELMLLTLCKSLEDVVDILAVGCRRLNVFDALTARKVLRLLFIDSLVDNVALVACHYDWCILTNLVDKFSMPLRCTLE